MIGSVAITVARVTSTASGTGPGAAARGRRRPQPPPARGLELADHHDVARIVPGVPADDVATRLRPEPPGELPLHEGEAAARSRSLYSPRCASEARSVTFSACFDGFRLTSGLSIVSSRSISLIHCLGFSTALTCLAALLFVPYSGFQPTWMWS